MSGERVFGRVDQLLVHFGWAGLVELYWVLWIIKMDEGLVVSLYQGL